MEFNIIKKSYGGTGVANLEKQAEEIIIITPDLFWDLQGGFTDIVLKGLEKGKTYTYIISYNNQKEALKFFKLLQRNRFTIRGKVSIYLIPCPILFEVAIYKFSDKPPIYLLVADRDDEEKDAIDIRLTSNKYKAYIDKFVKWSLINYTKVLTLG